MFRLQHTSVSGFPRCGSIAACHTLRPAPPSSNRTCGFPASGFPGNSRLEHSQGVARFKRSQGHHPQYLKMLVHRSPSRRSKGSLAPSFKMRYQTKLKETVDLAKCLAWITIVKVVAPAYQLSVNFPNHARNRRTTPSSCSQIAQLIALIGNGLVRRKHVEVSLVPILIQTLVETKCEPQKVKGFTSFFQVYHSGLFAIELQPHPGFQLIPDPALEPFTLVARKDNKVICVSHEAGIGPNCRAIRFMEYLVKPVQVEIREQGRDYPTLRTALAWISLRSLLGLALTSAPFPPAFTFRWLHHRGLQPHTDQFQDRSVSDPHLKACHQLIMGDRIEVSFQISVIHIHKPLYQVVPDTVKRLMGRASRAKSERTILKVRLKDGLQNQECGHLHHSITHRWNAQRAHLPIGLWYVDPSHGMGTVGSGTKQFLDFSQEHLRTAFAFKDIFNGYPVHSSRTFVSTYQFPCRQQHIFPKYPVIQRVEPEFRFLLGLQAQFLSQSREFLWQLNTLSQSGRWAFSRQILRSGTFVQAVLLLYRQKHVSGQVPWLHGHYPASQLLWTCPTPDQGHQRVISSPWVLWLGPRPVGPPRFLDQSVSTRRPLSPRRAQQLHTPVTSLPALGFTYPGRMATLSKFNEAETDSLALRLAPSPHEASPDRVTPSHARSATCQTDNFQGEHFSVHKIGQALPGAPG